MAYDLHITPKISWAYIGPRITRDEWDSLLKNGVIAPTELANYPADTYAKSGETYFHFQDGDITSAGPTEEGVKKMKEIANLLGAKVQGDDGDLY